MPSAGGDPTSGVHLNEVDDNVVDDLERFADEVILGMYRRGGMVELALSIFFAVFVGFFNALITFLFS